MNLCIECNIESSDIGQGIYTCRPIRAGHLVWENRTPYRMIDIILIGKDDFRDMNSADQKWVQRYSWQETSDLWAATRPGGNILLEPANLFNHSCDPNCWFEGDNRIVAIRDIEAGEMLTLDYATCDSDTLDNSDILLECCMCRQRGCRGVIFVGSADPKKYRDHSRENVYTKYMPRNDGGS